MCALEQGLFASEETTDYEATTQHASMVPVLLTLECVTQNCLGALLAAIQVEPAWVLHDNRWANATSRCV